MKLIVTGSIAFDYLMSFPGKFTEHFLPEHMHRVSLSFLVDTMDKRRGGCGPNIAYTIALLGERPYLMATAGQDFSDYKAWMDAVNIDTSLVKVIDGKFCASFFCSTDQANNQIASFYTGAMANAGELSMRTVPGIKDALVIISPNDPDGMVQWAEECAAMGVKYIWDPGQQCARMEGSQLKSGVTGAFMVICNDYEFELIRQKTGMGEADILAHAPLLVDHQGREGLHDPHEGRRRGRRRGDARSHRGSHRRRRCLPRRLHEGPGDGRAVSASARSSAAWRRPIALEHLGGTSHAYTWARVQQALRAAFRRAEGLADPSHILRSMIQRMIDGRGDRRLSRSASPSARGARRRRRRPTTASTPPRRPSAARRCSNRSAPAVTSRRASRGETFYEAWDGKAMKEIWDVASGTMPEDNPGSLKQQEYGDILAYFLSLNEFKTGDAELQGNAAAMAAIKVEKKK